MSKKGTFGGREKQDVFPEASRDGSTAAPEGSFFDRARGPKNAAFFARARGPKTATEHETCKRKTVPLQLHHKPQQQSQIPALSGLHSHLGAL